jgi:sec-independent protein translocase protein TatB
VFDLSFLKLLVLGVLALIIFGPNQLPRIAAQAGRALREFRRMAEGARADLQESLGPEFSDFDLNELNPKYFIRKHLLDDIEGSMNGSSADGSDAADSSAGIGSPVTAPVHVLAPGESPPYDAEAT